MAVLEALDEVESRKDFVKSAETPPTEGANTDQE